MPIKPIRIGVLGTAKIAEKFILPALLDLPDLFEVAGIASRSMSRAVSFTKPFGLQDFPSYDAILSKEYIDAVYIPLPNALHYDWVKKALTKGIHVIVEKSLACTFNEVYELNQLAYEKKLVLIENFQFRFHSQLAFIKGLVTDGKIGELRSIRSSFGFPPFSDVKNIRYDKELGGGALLDAGAYPIKVVQQFMGADVEVAASSLYLDEKLGIDIWGGAFLKQKTGSLFAEISFGFDNYYQCSLELWGSKGKLSTNRIFTAPPEYVPELVLEVSGSKEIINLNSDHHFKNMLSHFYHLILHDENRLCEYEQNLNQARLIQELKTKAFSYAQ